MRYEIETELEDLNFSNRKTALPITSKGILIAIIPNRTPKILSIAQLIHLFHIE